MARYSKQQIEEDLIKLIEEGANLMTHMYRSDNKQPR